MTRSGHAGGRLLQPCHGGLGRPQQLGGGRQIDHRQHARSLVHLLGGGLQGRAGLPLTAQWVVEQVIAREEQFKK